MASQDKKFQPEKCTFILQDHQAWVNTENIIPDPIYGSRYQPIFED